MVKWNSPEELAVDAAAFDKLMHCMAGVYFWEWATSLDFEWSFITRKRKFHWPLIFYLADRYFLLFAMIGILIALDYPSKLNCQALYTFNQLAGDAAIGLACINLAIRTMAIWSQSLYIVIPLVLVILGHWSLLLQSTQLKAEYIPGTGCAITQTNNTVLAATFIYSMCFDALVMVLSVIKLGRQRSQIVSLLFKDGMIYFIVSFIANLIATVFMVLNLNSVMNVIFNVPAAVVSTTFSCRAVRRLTRFNPQSPEVFQSTSHSGGVRNFRSANVPVISDRPKQMVPSHMSGVHVQMQTFTVTDDVRRSYSPEARTKPVDLESADTEFDFKPDTI